MTTAVFIGIDGGGSGCRAALADASGNVIATGSGGPANAFSDFSGAVESVLGALDAALSDAGLDTRDVATAPAHIGLAGILTSDDAARFAARLPLERAQVTDDRPTTLAGALGEADGLLAAIGTGSFIAAQTQGDMRFAGGWGMQVGDQASGAWAGRRLLEQVLLSVDGLGPDTPITRSTLNEFDYDTARIVAFARRASPADYARLAPGIVTAARNDDPIATAIMTEGAAYIEAAIVHLDPGPATPICLTGGLGPHYRPWLSESSRTRVTDPKGTALDGALILARRKAP